MPNTTLQAMKIKAGPDMYYQGHTVYVTGIPIGNFDKPWDVIIKIRRGFDAWAKSLIEQEAS